MKDSIERIATGINIYGDKKSNQKHAFFQPFSFDHIEREMDERNETEKTPHRMAKQQSRFNLRLQRSDTGIRPISRVRNAFDESKANQRFSIRRHEHLQCCRIMSNHRTGCNGDSITTGCIVRIYVVGGYLLLFSQHVADFCAKGLYH